jgi:hypothetical protein
MSNLEEIKRTVELLLDNNNQSPAHDFQHVLRVYMLKSYKTDKPLFYITSNRVAIFLFSSGLCAKLLQLMLTGNSHITADKDTLLYIFSFFFEIKHQHFWK